MSELRKYYLLGGNTQDVRFYAIFTEQEYKLLQNDKHDVEWVGMADSEQTVAECWLNQKEFPIAVEKDFLESLSIYDA